MDAHTQKGLSRFGYEQVLFKSGVPYSRMGDYLNDGLPAPCRDEINKIRWFTFFRGGEYIPMGTLP